MPTSARGFARSLLMPACLFGGPALWLAAMVCTRWLAQWRCGPGGAVAIHAVAAGGCLLIAYVSLRSVRDEGRELGPGDRGWFFAAGLIAVLCMTGIGTTAIASAAAGKC
jgi:hypothetical protein